MLGIQGSAADELFFEQDRLDPGPHEINAGREAGRAPTDNYRFIGIAHNLFRTGIAYHVRDCKDSPFTYRPDPHAGYPFVQKKFSRKGALKKSRARKTLPEEMEQIIL